MFKKLTEFGHTRTKKEAFGFYLAYLLFNILFSGLMGGVVRLFMPEEPFESAFQAGIKHGALSAIVLSLVLVVLVLRAKKFFGDFKYILLIPVTGLFSFFGGSLLGLIPIAYLTTCQQVGEEIEENVSKIPTIGS
jgi:hypothetical protein